MKKKDQNNQFPSIETNQQHLHELEVHQVELEQQNEELLRVQELLESERARYFDLFELAPVAYCTLSEKGVIMKANLTAANLLGMKRCDLAGSLLTRFITKEDQDKYYLNRKLLFETGAPQSCEMRMLHQAGMTFWARLEATASKDADGSPLCLLAVSDISTLKQKENLLRLRLNLLEFSPLCTIDEQLRKALDELEEITDSSIGFFHFVEEDQKTLTLQVWSTRTEKEFCRAEGKGMHYGIEQAGVWADCVHARRTVIHNDYASLPYRKGLPAGHAPVIRELVVPIIRDDRVVAILGVGNKVLPYSENDEEIIKFLADVCWEIVRRKQAELALRESHALLERRVEERTAQLQQEIEAQKRVQAALHESEERFRTIADFTYDWEYWIDPEGRFLYSSPSAARITGYGPDAFRDDPGLIHRLIHPDDRPLWNRHIRETNVEGHVAGVASLTFRLITAQGGICWVDHICQPVQGSDGRHLGRRVSNRDVTDKMAISCSLELAKQRLTGIIDGTNAGSWEWNVQTGEVHFNERWAEIVGHTLEELAPISIQTWLDLVHPDDLEESNAKLQIHFSGAADHYECECRMRHRNGSWVWVHDRGRVIEWTSDGKPLYMSGIHTEISARKQMEKTVRTSQANFRAFFDLSMEFLFVLDEGGIILQANRSVFDRLGYHEDEVIGQSVLMMHPPEMREEAGQIVQAMLNGERDYCPLPLIGRDGRYVMVETRIVKGVWDDKPALFGVSKDVSELAFSEEKFAKAFDTSPSLMAISDAESNRIIDVNQSFISTLGFSREEILGRTSRELGMFYDISQRDAVASAAKRAGVIQCVELAVYDKKGNRRLGEFSAQVITIRGKDHLLTVMNDITARKRAEAEIKQQASLIRSLLDSIPDIIFFKDNNGVYLGCNPPFAEFVGRPWQQIIGKTDYELFNKDIADFFREQDQLMLAIREPRHNEEWITYPDGRKILIDTLKTPYWGPDGKLIGVLGISRDITERKQVEEAIRNRESYLSAIIENQPGLLWLKDKESRFLAINKAFAASCGEYKSENILGKTDLDIWPRELAEKYRRDDFMVMETGKPTIGEEAIFDQGETRWFETFKSPVFDGEGLVIGTTGYARDITERKATEKVLLDVSERLHLAIRAANVGIWDWDITNDRLTWDEGMYNLYGISAGEFGGAYGAWETGLHPDDLPAAREAIQRALRGEGVFDPEFRVVRPDGSIRYIKADARIKHDPEGKPVRMIGTNWDITEQMTAVQAADAANQAKRTFLANMSHEIRTPLSGVLGMTALLMETELTDRQRRYAENIKTSAESLLAVLNDILDFSRIEAGKLTLEKIPFSIIEVIRNVKDIFEPLVSKKGIVLYSEIDPDLPAFCLGDPLRLRQVINNLVGNAVKFTAAGNIRLGVTARRGNAADIELEISVRDTGIGMTTEELAWIFSEFTQADVSTSRNFGGTGLGLAIVKQLVELMGGTLRAESVSGKGSVFSILIPFQVALDVSGADLPGIVGISRERFCGVRALVVEDHKINQEIVVEMLRQVGIKADVAMNGRDAVAMVQAQDYDILFMDIQMPEMDGFAATREIRNLPRAGIDRLPILAMTAHALTGDREKSLTVGMNDHLTKPINPAALAAALQRWLPPEKCTTITTNEPEAMAKQDLMTIPSMTGLDAAAALKRLGGKTKLYLKLLDDFIVGYREIPELLRQAMRAGLQEEALHRVHSIRGIAATLGGTDLEAAATELENVFRNAESCDDVALKEPLKTFIDCFETMIAAIGAVLSLHSEATQQINRTGKPWTAAELNPLLVRLKEALVSEEPKPCKEILAVLLQRPFPESQDALIAKLDHLVQRYRLADAFTLLDKEYDHIIRSASDIEGRS